MVNAPTSDNGSRLAKLASDAYEATFHKLAPYRQKMRDDAISAWLEGHEADAAELARGVLAGIVEHPDVPAEARPIFEMLTRPEHQTQAILTVLGVYPIISAFVGAAVQPFVQDIANVAWHGHPSAPLSPSEVALAKLRNAKTPWNPYDEAARSGINAERFDVLEYITGEPPGLMQLLEAYRRGFISEDRLHVGVLQSRVRDEWFQTVLDLRFAPPSPLEAVAGVVKGHLSDDEGRKIAAEGGLSPEHFDWVRDTAGRPPGAEAMIGLLHRGIINAEQFREAIRQSDIQNRWTDDLIAAGRYLPPPRTIVSMLHHGAIGDDKARTLLEWHGVAPEDIDLFLREGHASRTETIKHLALGEVRHLYDARMVTLDEAVIDIKALGYNDAQAKEMLALVDSAKERKYREAGITRVHALMINHRIDMSEASADLDKLSVNHEERDTLLKLWRLETQSNVRILTLAQVQGAWRRKIMSTAEAATRLEQLGYHHADVPSLLALSLPPTKFPQRDPKEIPA